ncbi:MAG: O-antigen ligase family protein, partial [Candidatus Sumerlaeia bacterium]|nr:O-antigen ligase family protein [Candidatus Sumerlaeia bacterium]
GNRNGSHCRFVDPMIYSLVGWSNTLIEALAIAAIVWSTLALGAAWGWGFAIAFALLAASFLIWATIRFLAESTSGALQSRKSSETVHTAGSSTTVVLLVPPLRIHSPWFSIFTVCAAAYLIFQVLPLPVSVVRVLSPARVTHEQRFAQALGKPMPATLTLAVDKHASRRALTLAAAAIMAFAAGAYLSHSRSRIHRVMRALLFLALFEAVYGLAENLSGHGYIYWIPVGDDVARGSFFNRNHFAATLALFLPIAIGWFYFRASAVKSRHEASHILPATSLDVLGSKQGLWLLLPAVLVVAIIQSQSRGGFSSMLLAAALMFGIGARTRSARTLSFLAIPLALAMFAYGLNSDYQLVLDRFGELTRNTASEGRTTIWKDSMGILRDYSLFGVGLGNFPRVYMQYASVGTLDYPYMAHNEWLEGVIALGWVGMTLLLLALIAFFVKTFSRIRHAGPDYPWLLGCWCGLLGLAFHSFAEFNFHIPSITITACFLAGILMSANILPHKRRGSHVSRSSAGHGSTKRSIAKSVSAAKAIAKTDVEPAGAADGTAAP